MPWDELRYVLYARAFKWTPDQVDEIPLRLEPWILPIFAAMNQADHARNERAQAQAAQPLNSGFGGIRTR